VRPNARVATRSARAAAPTGLLRLERAAAIASAHVLHALPAAAGSARAVAAPARESMCVGPAQLHARQRVGAQHALTQLHATPWGPRLVVQGCLVLRPFGASLLWRSACALTRECSVIWALTTRCLHVQLLELA
jgi:hypothetical protein